MILLYGMMVSRRMNLVLLKYEYFKVLILFWYSIAGVKLILMEVIFTVITCKRLNITITM